MKNLNKSILVFVSFITILVSILFNSIALNAQTNVLPGQQFSFDYPTSAVIDFGIRRFELKIDNGNYQDVGLPMGVAGNAELTTFRIPIPAITPGQHTAVIRACNDTGCSGDSNIYTFTMVIIPVPSNLRVDR